MKVTVYSTTTCPYCKMLKDYLTENDVVFTEKLVDQDDEARKNMVSISGGFMGVPYTVIEKDDGERQQVVGFDKGLLSKTLGL